MLCSGGKRNIFLVGFALAVCANLSIVQHFQLQRENLELKRRLDSLTGWSDGDSQGTLNYQQYDNNPLPGRRSEVSVSTLQESLISLWKQLVLQTAPEKTGQLTICHWRRREASDLGENDITLITHGSITKLDILLTELKFWNGPCSVALYVNDGLKQIKRLAEFVVAHEEELRQTSIHLFFEYTAPLKYSSDPQKLAYPHNPLRNLAMDHSNSDYIVALDMDFVPGPPNCYDRLMKALSANDYALAMEMRKNRRILVLPAFEVHAPEEEQVATPDLLPNTKAQMMEMVEADKAEAFHVKRFPVGHGPTNFTKWFEYPEQTTFEIDVEKDPIFYPITFRPGFEPYILAYRPGIPRYWNTFRGYGMNKMSWFMELHRAGYSFGSLTQEYVVHLEHPSTRNGQELRLNVEKILPYLDYLDYRYPIFENRQILDHGYYFSFRAADGSFRQPSDRDDASKWQRFQIHPERFRLPRNSTRRFTTSKMTSNKISKLNELVAEKIAERNNATKYGHKSEQEQPSQSHPADNSTSRQSLEQPEIGNGDSSGNADLNANTIDATVTTKRETLTSNLSNETTNQTDSTNETSSKLRGRN